MSQNRDLTKNKLGPSNGSNVERSSVNKATFNSETKKNGCVNCNKVFNNSSDLRRHERTHYTEKAFHCSFPKCLFSAYQNANLLAHENTHRSIESRLSYICPLCKKSVSSKSILTRHQKTCDGKTREQKSLKTQANLCSVCQKHFSTTHKLNNHKKSHTGDLQFKCDICNKAFSSNEALVKHALIHGEKSFRCNYCEKRWTRKDHLQQHMKVHIKDQKKQDGESNKFSDQEKPLDYLCGICGKTFAHSQKEVLLQHLASHHPGNSQSSVQTSFHDIITYEECDTGKIVLATSISSPQCPILENGQSIVLQQAYPDTLGADGRHYIVNHHGAGGEQYIIQHSDDNHFIVHREETGQSDRMELLAADQVIVKDDSAVSSVMIVNNSLIPLPHLAIMGNGEIIVTESAPQVIENSSEEEVAIPQNDDYEGNLIIVENDRLLVESSLTSGHKNHTSMR